MQTSLIKLFHRDLDHVIKELQSYSDEGIIWRVKDGISNSAGNLALHLVGNLNHFIGATIGNTGYIRQRDKEFSDKNVSVATLSKMLLDTKEMIAAVLNTLSDDELQEEYRRNPFEAYMTTEYFLLHPKSHLAYHLGQINYHRRLFDS